MAPSAPLVSHLLFADDNLLFFKSDRVSAEEVKDILQVYCEASGQQVNMDKSSIHFAKGCPGSLREEIKGILGVDNEALCEKYLGMPTDVGSSSNGAFKYLKDWVWARVQGWMEKTLSAGGKEVLIKAVGQAIPTYSMSCFKLPRGLCKHIDSLLRNFWWGSKEGKRKTCWVAWDDMTKPKYAGGLGFRDIEMFNLALLARQAWRVMQEPNSFSARILKAVYYPEGDFLDAEAGSNPSRVWRAIVEGKGVLAQGIIRRIGTGESTRIWDMNWLPRDGMMRPLCCTSDNPPQMVGDFIDSTSARWSMQLLKRFFTPLDIEAIANIPLCTDGKEDFWAWQYEWTGVFSVRSAYRMLVQRKEVNTAWLESKAGRSDTISVIKEWTNLWRVKCPRRYVCFCGGWPVSQSQLEKSDAAGTWLPTIVVVSARLRTHGGMRSLSAIWHGVSGR